MGLILPFRDTIYRLGLDKTMIINKWRLFEKGFVESLPNLKILRWGHGCGSYKRSDGTLVILYKTSSYLVF